MITLKTLLNTRTHRELELLARAHNLPFTRREPKAQGLAQLTTMLEAGAYVQGFRTLTDDHIAALHALVAAGGWLPLGQFTHHFGEIRPYKPWRPGFRPRHPWRYPASVAERLYQLGYIVIHEGDMVGLLEEVAALLPPLPQPEPEPISHDFSHLPDRSALLRDVAALLGILLRLDVVPVHGRWLPLSVLRALNPCLLVPEQLDDIRSELQTGRVRWLHYLAVAAGLVSIQGDYLKPTVSAWAWLKASPDEQWGTLMDAVVVDLGARNRLWDQFRFPDVSVTGWQIIQNLIVDCSTAKIYHLRDILATLKPYLLTEHPVTLAYLVRDILAWSGQVTVRRARVGILPKTFSAITDHPVDTPLHFRLPALPSATLVRLISFAELCNGWVTINAAAIKTAVERGFTQDDVVGTLQTVYGRALPDAIHAQIQHWYEAATVLTLGQMVILTSDDSLFIDDIRANWRLAGYFTAQVSPHHLIVPAEKAHELMKRLQRRGYPITSLLPQPRQQQATEALNPAMADYLLLAVRTYQGIQAQLNADVRIPRALTHWLTQQATDPTMIDGQVTRLVQSANQQFPSALSTQDTGHTGTIRQWVRAAFQHGQPLTIDYYSPSHDGETTRTIEIDDIYDAHGQTYIKAFCQLAGDTRTFRMDRIQRVHHAHQQASIAI